MNIPYGNAAAPAPTSSTFVGLGTITSDGYLKKVSGFWRTAVAAADQEFSVWKYTHTDDAVLAFTFTQLGTDINFSGATSIGSRTAFSATFTTGNVVNAGDGIAVFLNANAGGNANMVVGGGLEFWVE